MIGIVLLNYNNWQLTVDCIKSIQNTTQCDYRIYVVDNASKVKALDSEIKYINDNKNVSLIFNSENKGYAAGNNIGMKCAIAEGCDHILISNNDVIFSEGCIDELKNYLDKNDNVALVGPKVILPSGDLQEINMGCKMTMKGKYLYLLRKTPLKFMSNSFVHKFHAKDRDISKPFIVYGVSGCCFMISSKYINELCPFDENTFLYEEENILANRVERINKHVVYDSNVSIIHIGGASTKGMSEFAYMCQVESEIYYCGKCLESNRIALKMFILLRSIMYIKYFGWKSFGKYKERIQKMYKKISS